MHPLFCESEEHPRLVGGGTREETERGFLTGQVDMAPGTVDLDDLFAHHSHREEDFADDTARTTPSARLIIAAGCHNARTLRSIPP